MSWRWSQDISCVTKKDSPGSSLSVSLLNVFLLAALSASDCPQDPRYWDAMVHAMGIQTNHQQNPDVQMDWWPSSPPKKWLNPTYPIRSPLYTFHTKLGNVPNFYSNGAHATPLWREKNVTACFVLNGWTTADHSVSFVDTAKNVDNCGNLSWLSCEVACLL